MLRNTIAAFVLLIFAHSVFGLGLGSLQKSTALNEPFSGKIEILGATANDFDSLSVRLATREQFERAGVPRDAVLLNLKFRVVQARNGDDFVQVTSHEPIKEPFLNFLLELTWANGRLVREYTVLLDPPLYDPVRATPAPASPAPAVTAQTMPESAPTPAPMMDPAPAPTTVAPAPAAPYSGGDTLGPVSANDTLWSIASASRPADVSVQQMMIALFRANPDAFGDNNINVLKRGVVLRMPDASELNAISQSAAIAEARKHHQMWDNYRQQATAEVGEQPIGADMGDDMLADEFDDGDDSSDGRLELVAPDGGEDTTGIGTGDAGATPSLLQEELDAQAQQNSELRAKIAEADEIIDLLERQVDIKDEELAALQARLAELGIEHGDLVTATEDGVTADEMDDDTAMDDTAMDDVASDDGMEDEGIAATEDTESIDELFADEADVASDGLDEALEDTEAGAEEMVTDDVEIDVGAADEEVIATDTTSETPPPEESFLDSLIPAHISNMVPGGAMTVLGAIAALLLLVFGGIIKWLMGGKDAQEMPAKADDSLTAVAESADDTIAEADEFAEIDVEEAEDVTDIGADEGADIDEIPGEFEDTLEATADQLSPAPPEEPEVEEDPLEEVNVYLAYERFDQAEELVRKVIADNPDEHKYKLRLLEVFYSSNDKASYEATAKELVDAVGESDPLWESAVAMWGEMSPDRALFAEGGEAETVQSAEDTGGMQAFVDITGDDDTTGDTVSMGPDGENLEATAVGLTNEQETGPVDFNLTDDESSADTEDGAGTVDLDLTAVSDDDMLDLTAGSTGADDGDDIFDLTAATDSPDDVVDLTAAEAPSADVVDLTSPGGDLSLDDDSPLDLTTPSDSGDLDLLDVTKTGDVDGTSDDILNVTAPGALDETTAPTSDDDSTIDFDISETVTNVFDDQGEPEGAGDDADESVLDITGGDGEDTLDFEIGGLEDTTETAEDDLTVEFDGGSIESSEEDTVEFDVSGDDVGDDDTPTVEMEAASDNDTVDFDLSLQSAELDELSDTSDAAPEEGDAAIEFDLSLEDTSDMDSIAIDETLEIPKQASADESIEDLTKSMEESMAGLDLDIEDGADGDEDLELGLDDDDLEIDVGDLEIGADDDTISIEAGNDIPEDDSLAVDETLSLSGAPGAEGGDVDEIDTKLNLAKAYIELGDNDGARSILDEVNRDGSEEQQAEAQKLLDQL